MKTCLSTLALSLCLLLAACGEEKIGVSYGGVNNTDKNIVSVVVNGEGGVLDVTARGGGETDMCCVVIPKKWRSGLKVTIKWQEGGTFQLDQNGNRLYNNGVPVVIEGPWKERTVDIPEYKEVGMFFIHFFPNDEIKVAVSRVFPGHPDYPIPDPEQPPAK